MKINIDCLRNYIKLPESVSEIKDLMEDVGIEVKKSEKIINDDIFTLELLANRGDHYCYKGIAREIYGRTGWELKEIEIIEAPVSLNSDRVKIKTNNCLNYVISEFKKRDILDIPLDKEKARMLTTTGANLILPVVDVTNFINIEIGQPMHAFDADKIEGQLCVRETKKGEKALLLFTKELVDVPEGTIVISDDNKILAIAGVMGCEYAKPTEETKRIYLESATFDPVKVRKAARYFGIQSQSSMRFERGADPVLAMEGTKRAVKLYDDIGWDIVGSISQEKKWDFNQISIPINISGINSYFEINLKAMDIINILSRYGFKCSEIRNKENIDVVVPSFRVWDVKEYQDIYEDIAHGIGFNSLPSSLPAASKGVQPLESLKRKEKIENILVSEGFYEIFTDVYYSETHRKKLCQAENKPLWSHVNIINASDRSYSLLKNNTLVQAMDLIVTNVSAKNPNIKAFEWTRTFHPNEKANNGLCDEKFVLWSIALGKIKTPYWNDNPKELDVYYMKGLIEEISNILNIKLDFRQSETDDDISAIGLYLHPTRRASIYWNNKQIGVLGEVHPSVVSSWGLKSVSPCYFEISQDILDVINTSKRIYVAPSNLHSVIRDICLMLPKNVYAQDIANYMKETSLWITEVFISDVFNSQEITEGKNAVTFSLNYSLEKAKKDKFTNYEINDETERLVASIIKKYQKFKIERR